MFTAKVLSQYWSHQFSCIDCLLRAQLYQGQSILTETASCVLLRMHIIAQHIIAHQVIGQSDIQLRDIQLPDIQLRTISFCDNQLL